MFMRLTKAYAVYTYKTCLRERSFQSTGVCSSCSIVVLHSRCSLCRWCWWQWWWWMFAVRRWDIVWLIVAAVGVLCLTQEDEVIDAEMARVRGETSTLPHNADVRFLWRNISANDGAVPCCHMVIVRRINRLNGCSNDCAGCVHVHYFSVRCVGARHSHSLMIRRQSKSPVLY